MYTLLLIAHVIVSLFLIFIILIQSSKGDGVSDVFGGGSSQTTIFGTRASTFLTKATSAGAIIFMITCLILGLVSRRGGGSVMQRELFKDQMQQKMDDLMKGKPAEEQAATAQASSSAEVPGEQPAQPVLPASAEPATAATTAEPVVPAPAPAAQ